MENNDTNLKLANVIFDLAKNAEESGKYEDAIKSYKEVLNVFEQALGAEDEKTKEVYTNIGMCYKALGKNEEALTYLTKALSSSNTTSVVQKQETAIAKQDTEVEEAEDEELEEEDEELILLREADSLYALGKENLGNKKYKKAIEYFKEALRIFNEVEGEGSESSAYMYEYIANCYFDEKNYNEAINYYAWALEIFDKMPDSDNDQSRYCCERLDYCNERLDNYKDTKYYLEECSEIGNNRVDLGLYSMEEFTQTYDLIDIAKDKSKKIYEYYKKNPEKLKEHIAIAKKAGKKIWQIYNSFK